MGWRKDKFKAVANKLTILAKKVNFDPFTMFIEVIMTCNCCNFPMFT